MTIPVNFNTIYGNLLLQCKYDDTKANLSIGECSISIGIAILRDRRSVMKSNESSDSKHQVNPDTLEIDSITINHEYLRILWTFVETDGFKRNLGGNLYRIYRCQNEYVLTNAHSFSISW